MMFVCVGSDGGSNIHDGECSRNHEVDHSSGANVGSDEGSRNEHVIGGDVEGSENEEFDFNNEGSEFSVKVAVAATVIVKLVIVLMILHAL